MKLLSTLFALLLLSGCSSPYTPNEKTRQLIQNMSSEQAIAVLQRVIWGNKGNRGICGSRGFWFDEDSDVKIQTDKIVILAHRKGRQLHKGEEGFSSVVVYEKQYYFFNFEFFNVNAINIYRDPKRLPVFPLCNKKDATDAYFIIDLFHSKTDNLKFTVAQHQLDETMAALSIVLKDKAIINK